MLDHPCCTLHYRINGYRSATCHTEFLVKFHLKNLFFIRFQFHFQLHNKETLGKNIFLENWFSVILNFEQLYLSNYCTDRFPVKIIQLITHSSIRFHQLFRFFHSKVCFRTMRHNYCFIDSKFFNWFSNLKCFTPILQPIFSLTLIFSSNFPIFNLIINYSYFFDYVPSIIRIEFSALIFRFKFFYRLFQFFFIILRLKFLKPIFHLESSY